VSNQLERWWHVLILSSLILSCNNGSTGPVGGILQVHLRSAHGDDGAVLFTVTGGAVESVEAIAGTVHTAPIDANTLRVVVTGDLSSRLIARIHIPDVTQASHYSSVINDVAARNSYVVRDLSGYSISLEP
jgi:hypothetical protein